MARLWSSGPVDVWVALGETEPPSFLGHGRRAPKVEAYCAYTDVLTDAGGPRLPADRLWAGEVGFVSVLLTRYVEATLRRIQDRAGRGRAGAAPGRELPGVLGTLMAAEGLAYPLYLRFPYATKQAMRGGLDGDMVQGYQFHRASLDPETITAGTGDVKAHALRWACLRLEDDSKENEYGSEGFLLYDNDMSALPPTPPAAGP